MSDKKLWGGRFTKDTDKQVNDFNSSIAFDARLYKQDIEGSIAHATMLGETKIISKTASDKIVSALKGILRDIEAYKVVFDIDAEDIHMNVEKILIERIGEAGKMLHTGRSRNDQVALDIRMYLKEELATVENMLNSLKFTLVSLAEENVDTIMPGYTHLQKAQPINLAHYFMAYYEMFSRDTERIKECYARTNTMPLGSGALAGTTFPIDRKFVKEQLGFAKLTKNSLDAVSDRDFVLEFAFCNSLIMMHLSRFAEELILWSTNEFGTITIDDAYSTGSSIMPQKKNPDVAELVRGKTGRVYGDLMGLLTIMKGLPLAYNKDMQEDKEAIFDSIDTVKLCLPVFTDMIKTMKINKEKMFVSASGGFTNATDVADYLVKKGIPFRTAHGIVGNMVLYCEQAEIVEGIENLSMKEFKSFSKLIDDDIYDCISMESCVSKRNVFGGPAKKEVLKQIVSAKKRIGG